MTINRRGVGGIMTIEYSDLDDLNSLVERLTYGEE